jgi:hypothetical protein
MQITGQERHVGTSRAAFDDALADRPFVLAGRGVVLEDVVQDRDLALQCPERLCREAAGVLPDPDERRGDHANRRLIHAPQNEFEILGQGAAEGLEPIGRPDGRRPDSG